MLREATLLRISSNGQESKSEKTDHPHLPHVAERPLVTSLGCHVTRILTPCHKQLADARYTERYTPNHPDTGTRSIRR